MDMDMTMNMFKGMQMSALSNGKGVYVVEKIIK
jgi:hypothetical protein